VHLGFPLIAFTHVICSLANKQDCEGALDEVDIVEQLNVEAVVNQYRCPTLVEMCSATAVKNYHRKQDLAIHNGFR
jgi:ADP-ribosylation factor-like protein 13B